mmetsp:Transcript_26271/g.105137  ORF Transcript_26271/g.105137 Transcript_26271/m.105137 type:complete len:461 (+) Transcript_26271:2518-3900(+)
MEVLVRVFVVGKGVRRPNRGRTQEAREQRHVVAVARRRPVAAIVEPVSPLAEAERQLGGDVPRRVQRMRARVVAAAANFRRVDRLARAEGVRDEHDGFLGEREVVDAGAGGLDAEIVLVLDVDRAVVESGHLDVIRTSPQHVLAEPFVDDRRVGVHDGVHVARGGVEIVRVDRRVEHGALDRRRMTADHVGDRVARAREDDAIEGPDAVAVVQDPFRAVVEHVDRQDARVEEDLVGVFDEAPENFPNARARALPRDARREAAVVRAAQRRRLAHGVVGRRQQRDLLLDDGPEHRGEGPQLVDEEARRVVRREDDVPPLRRDAETPRDGVERDDVERVEEPEAGVVGVHRRRVAAPERRGAREDVRDGRDELVGARVPCKVLPKARAQRVPLGGLVEGRVGAPERALATGHLGDEEPRQRHGRRLDPERLEEGLVVLVQDGRPRRDRDARLDDARGVGGVG